MSTSHTEMISQLQSACQSQGIERIVRGRRVVGLLIEKVGIDLIEKLAYANLPLLDDDWEYRRLGELFATNHQDEALQRLIAFGLSSTFATFGGQV
ncbi:MAG: hypothetical protein ABSH20_05300 [Tepidisphaeraceae bacterium]|jgi:hypothetical protein